MALGDQWYIAIDPSKTEVKEVPSDLRGLDRIEYSAYSELGEKIQTVMAQRYPRRPTGTIDTYLAEQRKQTVGLLREEPGLTVTAIAQVLGVEVQVAQLLVRPLIEDGVLKTEGRRKATKYFIAGGDKSKARAVPTEMHLDEIGAICFRGQKPAKANSWARNSMRKLLANRLVRKTGRGIYAAAT